jgi:hypothetical protein
MIEQPQHVELPEALRKQFAALKYRLWRVETLAALSLAVCGLLLSCLAVFFSDRLWDTPHWLRVACLTGGLATVAWFGLTWIRQWIVRPRDQRELAVMVQTRYGRLGDRLLGIVELADERQRPADFSPALYRAAISQVATEASPYNFADAVDPQPARHAAWALGGLVLVGLALIGLSPTALLNAVSRWAAPTAAIPRFTLVAFDGLPREQVVAHGEAFTVSCSVQYRSFWKPRRGTGRFERQPPIVSASGGGQVQWSVPGQVEPGLLKLHLGDARAQVRILPTYRPSLKALTAAVQLPAYLKYAPTSESVENGSFNVLEGSRVAFTGKLSRSLMAAQMRVPGQSAQELPLHNETFTTEPLELDGVPELAFTWRDHLGLESAGPWRLQLHPQKDVPPTPELLDLLKDTAILESEVLELKAVGRDDFGVREIGVEWQLLTDVSDTNAPSPRPFNYRASTPHEKKVEDTFYLSPGLQMIPAESVLELRGFATDYYPDREPSYTGVYRVHVLGNERHAELVRQNLESLLTRLEEVTRLEEKVAATTKQLQDLGKDKLNTDQTAEQIAAAKEDQAQNAANLEQLAKEGKKTLREAARNPTFDEQTLRDWAKNMQEMQQLSDDKMQQAAQSLKSAQQNPDSRSEKLAQAAQQEQEVLDALEQMQRKVNKGLDQLQALTLAQRLRKVASDENDIANKLQKIVPDTIGMFPKELPGRLRNTEMFLAKDQETAQKDSQVLQGEIGRFFERTQKESYGDVSKQMTEEHVSDELDRLRGLIEENVAMDAIQNLNSWSDRLKAWAELLEPKSDSSAGGGGGGDGGATDEAMLKELLALLRARDRQINLRQRTGLLEKNKAQTETYAQGAKSLANAQGQLREDMNKLSTLNPMPALDSPLQEIVGSMQGVEELLNKPQTDRQTEVAQIKTIEQLSDVINLINENQQRKNNRSQSQSPSAEDMAFLMQMMALQNSAQALSTNPNGGGSQAGGTTDRAATPALGDPNAKPGDARTVNRASGTTANFPIEFREALEEYFKGVEKLEQKR